MSATSGRLEPGSAQWERLWEADPQAIYDQLSHAERQDPDLNPLHWAADPVAPSNRRRRPTWRDDFPVDARLAALLDP